MILSNKMATIYSSGVTFSKLLSLHRAAGLACSRSYKSFKNAKADRTPEQAKRNSPEAIDESPGPWKNYTDVHFWSQERVARRYGKKDDEKRLDEKLADMNIDPETADDMPVDMKNPYTKPFKKCIICEHNIELDYKNVQLLSQFISPYTGRIYGRQITGLCIPMQRRIQNLIKKAQKALLMPKLRKSPEYLQDPKLFTLARKTFPYGQ